MIALGASSSAPAGCWKQPPATCHNASPDKRHGRNTHSINPRGVPAGLPTRRTAAKATLAAGYTHFKLSDVLNAAGIQSSVACGFGRGGGGCGAFPYPVSKVGVTVTMFHGKQPGAVGALMRSGWGLNSRSEYHPRELHCTRRVLPALFWMLYQLRSINLAAWLTAILVGFGNDFRAGCAGVLKPTGAVPAPPLFRANSKPI